MIYSANVVTSASPGAVALFEDGSTFTASLVGATGQLTVQVEIDTGSTVSGVDVALLQQVGAQVVTGVTIPVQTPSGNAMDQLYQARLLVGGIDLFAGLPGVLGEYLPSGPRVLLGRDALAGMQYVYDGVNGTWSLIGTVAPQRQAAAGLDIAAGIVVAGLIAARLGTPRRRAA